MGLLVAIFSFIVLTLQGTEPQIAEAFSVVFSSRQNFASASLGVNNNIPPGKLVETYRIRHMGLLALFAAKTKKKSPASEALDKLNLIDDDETTLSGKELKKLAKQNKKTQIDDDRPTLTDSSSSTLNLSDLSVKKKNRDEILAKALEWEQADNSRKSNALELDAVDNQVISKKEEKALQKKNEKMAEKLEKKLSKKARKHSDSDVNDESVMSGKIEIDSVSTSPPTPTISVEEEPLVLTLEDKIRKERPPPRIRVMESSQPGYTSLRLENVGITFRNQEVLKDVTWGVQTGDRIGLVGANGAGKYKRILCTIIS